MSAVTAGAVRADLVRRARRLAWAGNAWHLVEFLIAVAAGLAAGSIALIAFGIDSLIELASGVVILWRFSWARDNQAAAELRARRLIAAGFVALAAYVAVESVWTLAAGAHPSASPAGIALAAVTAVAMPLLAREKRRVAAALGSAASAHEAGQNQLCAYLSLALLAGLGLNALFGAWWADPLAALVIGAFALREGLEAWRGEPDACC